MANTYAYPFSTSQNLYAILKRGSLVWNGSTFVSFVAGNIGDYDIPMPETVPGTSKWYVFTMPATVTAGLYELLIMRRVGASPSWANDQRVDTITPADLGQWDGADFTTPPSEAELIAAMEANFGEGSYVSSVPAATGYCNLTDTFLTEPGATVFFQLLNADPLTDTAIYDDREQSVNVRDDGSLMIVDKLVRAKRYRFRCDRFPGEYTEFVATVPDAGTTTMRALMAIAE